MKGRIQWLWRILELAGTAEDALRWGSAIVGSITVLLTGFRMNPEATPYVITAAFLTFAAILSAWSSAKDSRMRRPYMSQMGLQVVQKPPGIQVVGVFQNAGAVPAYRLQTETGWCPADNPDAFKLDEPDDGITRLGPGPEQFTVMFDIPAMQAGTRIYTYICIDYSLAESGEQREYRDEFFGENVAGEAKIGVPHSKKAEVVRNRASLRRKEKP